MGIFCSSIFFFFLIKPLSCSSGSRGADGIARRGNCLQLLSEPAAGVDLEPPMELHFMFVLLRGPWAGSSPCPPPCCPPPLSRSLQQAWGSSGGVGTAPQLLGFARAAAGAGFPQLHVPCLGQMPTPSLGGAEMRQGLVPLGQVLQTFLPISASL